MKLDFLTLAFILCLVFVMQVIVLIVQYNVNRAYRGIGWWLLGSGFMALGFIFMPLLTVKSLEILARIANPLVVLGQVFLYFAIIQFFDVKESRWRSIFFYALFIIVYYYFMYIDNDISGRTIVVSATVAVFSLMTAFKLYFKRDKLVSGFANFFTGTVFLIHGCFLTGNALSALLLPSVLSYKDLFETFFHVMIYVVAIVTSTLWTYGFIIMVNQRLNAENRQEREKLQQIFNTGPDAALITRMRDGLILDVNEGFSVLIGLGRNEVIGKSTLEISVWENIADRDLLIDKLNGNGNGICENLELVFKRKNGSRFFGIISARTMAINDRPHIISVVRDITERKLAEQQIQELLQQLEIERNTAYQNSITDSLTGLANRRYFDEVLEREFYRVKRSGSSLSLIMLDVDYFKKFNDKYGHLAGDDCLRQIGFILKTIARHVPDTVARYGGEEFSLILPQTDEKGAEVLAKRIRTAVESLSIQHLASDIAGYVTVSIGVVTVYPTGLASPEQVVALADEALYCAKKQGRNQIAIALSSCAD
ncbi:PAS domain S-box/diguanylate cyclase (GGDEF) domain-containing protein [Desulfosporosinus orientis DSM 765]|uniref:PAS domain S-box/diguanylate cyclase (GGDEF) domain-containing protein n=1 Tax=Desulfosporosinus orientis (strain ATCC 19365 / DSM 765 / NCIMB 8382 / VKM B-1628 / Singapore I) TaxID=768706 RepID=G7W6Q5_DESOD|nr:sensor domain-containing diguanylate cyclase [Desulfosporosinus orientis]AET69187.1 PAS domain S-box/diguanylate cyclase (GGDEF) domain-containing protein [Desulfosporosinus orientis DSM 765]